MNEEKVCPMLSAKAGKPTNCLKDKCVWWMVKDRNCAFVVGARALRNFDEEGVSMFTRETRGYFI